MSDTLTPPAPPRKAPRVPGWMLKRGIGEGEWLNAPKPALAAGMTPRFPLKTRVWCCGMLGSFGFQGERCFTMHRNAKIPLTSAAIANQLHAAAIVYYAEAGHNLTGQQKDALRPSRQNIRRALEELENDGIAERRNIDGALLRDLPADELRRLPSGRIRLHFFARPKRAKVVILDKQDSFVRFAATSPQESRIIWRALKHQGANVPAHVAADNYVGSVAGEAVRDYIEAVDVAEKHMVDRLLVATNRERIEIEKIERTKTENNNNTPPVNDCDDQQQLSIAGEEDVVVVPTGDRPEQDEAEAVYAALREHGMTTKKAAATLIARCREEKPDCTEAEIVETIRCMAAGFGRGVRSPVAVLLAQVPQAVISTSAPQPAPPDDWQSFQDARSRKMARQTLEDPRASEADRQLAREVLGEELEHGDQTGRDY